MQLRYQFRLYPTPGRQQSPARALRCARTLDNDALRARREAHAAGLPYRSDGDLSKLVITEAKKTTERTWPGEVSAVVSSKLCGACGTVAQAMPLDVREWACACGAVHDRDVNAARNILAAGRADRLNACGGTVSPPA